MDLVKRKKKEIFIFKSWKTFFGSGLFSMGSSDKGKQKYFISGPTIVAIPFHETVLARMFWVSCYQIILYTYCHVHGLWALKVVLWRSRHLLFVFKEYLETRNNLEEKENLWIQDLHLADPQVKPKTRGPLVLYRSPEWWGYVKLSGYWGKEV